MTRSGYITIGLMLLVLVAVFWFYQNVQKQNEADSLAASPAATALGGDAQYTDVDGNPVSLEDYVGQTAVVFAWASWCPSCVEQLTLLGSVSSRYEDVVVLAINRGEPIATAVSFLDFYNLDTNVELIMDPADYYFESVNGFSMPETVIFNQSGQIFHHERGAITEEELVFLLDSVQ